MSVRWHPLARRELLDAAGYYDAESPGLGTVFLDAAEALVDRLRRQPRSGSPLGGHLRRALVPRFPYSLIYRLDESGARDRLFILAVAHAKRRPRYWAGRIEE